MGHTKPENMKDLAPELEAIRRLDGIREKSIGAFYYRSNPFLHFHDKDGDRWADVKVPTGGYKRVDIPFCATKSARRGFLETINSAYAALPKGRAKK